VDIPWNWQHYDIRGNRCSKVELGMVFFAKTRGLKSHLLSRFFSRFKREEDGAAAVEFAFTLPIFMGLIIFAAEMARLVYTLSAISFAAAEASRFVVVNQDSTTDQVLQVAKRKIYGLDPGHLQAILVTAPLDTTDQTRLVTITIQYLYEPIFPVDVFLSDSYSDGFVLNGVSRGFLIEDPTGET